MDLTALIKQNIEIMNMTKEELKCTHDQVQKTQLFHKYVSSIENLNKVRNMKNLSKPVLDKLKEIILAATKDAETYKHDILQTNHDQNTTRKSTDKQNHGKNQAHESENSKEKKEFQDALRGAIITEKPNVKWENVAGLVAAKQVLKEAIIFPTKFPDVFVGLRKPWKGILLYGV